MAFQAVGALLVFIGELIEVHNVVKVGGYFLIIASLLAALRYVIAPVRTLAGDTMCSSAEIAFVPWNM